MNRAREMRASMDCVAVPHEPCVRARDCAYSTMIIAVKPKEVASPDTYVCQILLKTHDLEV